MSRLETTIVNATTATMPVIVLAPSVCGQSSGPPRLVQLPLQTGILCANLSTVGYAALAVRVPRLESNEENYYATLGTPPSPTEDTLPRPPSGGRS